MNKYYSHIDQKLRRINANMTAAVTVF